MIKILAIYDGSGPKYHRILTPMAALAGDNEFEVKIDNTVNEDNSNVDIVLFNRAIGGTSLAKILELKKKHGFKMINDLDDHWELGPEHILYDTYREQQLSLLIALYIVESDHVFVTHERLANEASLLNKNVHILPNALPNAGQFTFEKKPSDLTRLFWAGGITHDKDMELLRNPVKRFLDLPNIEMVMGGYSKNPVFLRMASAFTMGGKLNHRLLEGLPVTEYYGMYTECDISLVPLLNNRFNGFKSNLKILEAANMGCPVVISKVDPYLGFPEDLVNYVERQTDWNKHVRNLIKNPDLVKHQGQELKLYCDKYFNFDEINKERVNLLKTIHGK